MSDLRNAGPVAWTGTLLITWLFGILIGISLGYAIFSGTSPTRDLVASNSSDTSPAETPESNAPEEVEGPPTEVEEPPVPPSELEEEMADPDEIAEVEPEPEAEPEPRKLDTDISAGRHFFIAVNGQWLAEGTKEFLREMQPGGVLLRDVNLRSRTQTLVLVEEIKKTVGLGAGFSDLPLIGVSQEGGSENSLRLDNLPTAAQLGANGDADAARRLGRAMALECVSRGISVVFAPVLDVYEPGGVFPDFATRSFGSDPAVVSRMGLAMAEGLQAGGVIPVAKHFPGYGAATYGPDGLLVTLNKDYRGLAEVMFPFVEAIGAQVPGMVVANVAVPALDRENPELPAALSPKLVGELLRQHREYDGVIIADDLAMNPMMRSRTVERAVVEALIAGCDAVIFLDPDPERIRRACFAIEDAVRNGELTVEQLDAGKERLERWRKLLGAGLPESMQVTDAAGERVPGSPVTKPFESESSNSGFLSAPESPPENPLGEPEPNPTQSISPEMAEDVLAQAASEPQAVAESATEAAVIQPASETSEGTSRILHRLQENETIEMVAATYGVSTDDIHAWNASATTFTPGTSITIILDPSNEPEVDMEPEPAAAETEPEAKTKVIIPPTGKLFHHVAEGETLASIAEMFAITTEEIKLWNALEDDSLETGQVLTLILKTAPTAAGESEETVEEGDAAEATPEPATGTDDSEADVEPESADVAEETPMEEPEPSATDQSVENPEPTGEAESASTSVPKDADTAPEESPPVEVPEEEPVAEEVIEARPEPHVVEAGDTLYGIARLYKVGADTILKLNGIDDPNHIRAGQKLKIPVE